MFLVRLGPLGNAAISKKTADIRRDRRKSAKNSEFGSVCPFSLSLLIIQKNPHVHNFSARNSEAGNGSADFMGAWDFLVLSAEKPPCP